MGRVNTSLPTVRMPGCYSKDGRYHTHRQAARLIRKHGGRLVLFRNLPLEAQLALTQYMAIDGEALALAPGLDKPIKKYFEIFYTGSLTAEATKKWSTTLASFIPFYVTNYGDFEVGYIDALPIAALINYCTQDQLIRDVYGGGLSGWQQYHAWFVGRLSNGPRHAANDTRPWPVILSSFDNETIQDGWNRFHQYVMQGRQACPAIWYPHRPSRAGAVTYHKIYGKYRR